MSQTAPYSSWVVDPPKPAISTKREGGSGGTEFTLTNQEKSVTKIEVWTDKGTKDTGWSDRQLIEDIQLTWSDGTKNNITGKKSGNLFDFTFRDNEKVTSMTIRTGARVDQISFVTDKQKNGEYRKFSAGDSNGTAYPQLLGNGILLGFHGCYDKLALISIGAKFDS